MAKKPFKERRAERIKELQQFPHRGPPMGPWVRWPNFRNQLSWAVSREEGIEIIKRSLTKSGEELLALADELGVCLSTLYTLRSRFKRGKLKEEPDPVCTCSSEGPGPVCWRRKQWHGFGPGR